jgi:hypothetical protein
MDRKSRRFAESAAIKKAGRTALRRPGLFDIGRSELYLGAAGAFVAGGDDMSPESLQPTKPVSAATVRKKQMMIFFMRRM